VPSLPAGFVLDNQFEDIRLFPVWALVPPLIVGAALLLAGWILAGFRPYRSKRQHGLRRGSEHDNVAGNMTRPCTLKKMMFSVAELQAMQAKHRAALLLLGLFLNEANWLRKLLVKAVLGMSDTPEGQAHFALTALLATTLAGKIHEGWDRITAGHLHEALKDVDLPDELKPLQQELAAALAKKTFVRIRNNIAFHYPNRPLNFKQLTDHLDDSDAIIYMVPEGYAGDVLSHLSTLAGIEPLLAINEDADYRSGLNSVWDEVTNVAGLYCHFVSEVIASFLLKFLPNVSVEDITIPDAPEADEELLRFFVHPPSDLEHFPPKMAHIRLRRNSWRRLAG
jgi:hypothetical protein